MMIFKVIRLHFLSLHDPGSFASGARNYPASTRPGKSSAWPIPANTRGAASRARNCSGMASAAGSGRSAGKQRASSGLPTSRMQNGEAPKLLDIITIHVKEACPHAYQTENHRTAEGRWVRNGAFPFARLPELCDDVECLWINGYHSFNGRHDRMPLELAGRCPRPCSSFSRKTSSSSLGRAFGGCKRSGRNSLIREKPTG